MHDLGTSATRRGGKRVRGGGYWGIQSEQDLDLAAWTQVARVIDGWVRRAVLAGR